MTDPRETERFDVKRTTYTPLGTTWISIELCVNCRFERIQNPVQLFTFNLNKCLFLSAWINRNECRSYFFTRITRLNDSSDEQRQCYCAGEFNIRRRTMPSWNQVNGCYFTFFICLKKTHTQISYLFNLVGNLEWRESENKSRFVRYLTVLFSYRNESYVENKSI